MNSPADIARSNDLNQDSYNLLALLEEQGRILEMIADGKELREILNAIILWVQKESKDEVLASILLLDPATNRLMHGAAPSLPDEYNKAIHGVSIGPSVGSCGTAAFTRQRVIVDNIETDPLWNDFKHLALKFDLRACWSTPLITKNGSVLGTFAMYYKRSKNPSYHDLQVIRLISSTTVLAIEREKAEIERKKLWEIERVSNAKIKEERGKLFGLLMGAPALVAVMAGPNHVFELANEQYMEIVGSQRSIIGKTIREALPELEGQGIYELLDNVFKTGEPYNGNEVLVQLQKGDKMQGRYFNFAYLPVKNNEGITEGIFVHAVDVTELVKAKYKAQESEEMFRSFVLNSPTPIAIYIGKEMRIQTANNAVLKAWEKDKSVVGKTLKEALPELDGQPFHQLLDSVFTTGISYHGAEDVVYLMREGKLTITYWNFTYKALFNEKGEIYGVINTATEITELVKAKQKLTEAQETLKSAIDIAELGTWAIDIPSNYVTYSQPIGYWLGLPEGGTSMNEIISRIDPDDRETVLSKLQVAIEKNGFHEVEYKVVNPLTGEERILHSKGKIVLDENNNPASLNGVSRDITLQKQTETALAKEVEKRTFELQRANNDLNSLNENLKQFIYIASHDLQEPLRKINMFSDMFLKAQQTQLDDSSKFFLDKISKAAKRMTTLIRDLLDYSRAEAGDERFVATDLNLVIKNVIEDYEVLIQEKGANIHCTSLPAIDAIPMQMNQLFYNLIGNALKFSKSDQSPEILISSRRLTVDEVLEIKNLHAEWQYIELTIEDNGIGFAQKFAPQLFVIFQRLHTRDDFDGTGIGLALCKKIVENHSGIIVAEGKENVGAKFRVILPEKRYFPE